MHFLKRSVCCCIYNCKSSFKRIILWLQLVIIWRYKKNVIFICFFFILFHFILEFLKNNNNKSKGTKQIIWSERKNLKWRCIFPLKKYVFIANCQQSMVVLFMLFACFYYYFFYTFLFCQSLCFFFYLRFISCLTTISAWCILKPLICLQ